MMSWFQTWAIRCTVGFSMRLRTKERKQIRESSISAMLGFRCLGEIQVNMAGRWLVVWVALEKKIEIKECLDFRSRGNRHSERM